MEWIISIHTTLAGGDNLTITIGVLSLISIHTTLAGGDLVMCMSIRMDTSFQSTPPSRVAT